MNVDKIYNSFVKCVFALEGIDNVKYKDVDIEKIIKELFNDLDKQKKIIDKYIKDYFKDTDDYEISIKNLRKLDNYLEMYGLDLYPGSIFYLINTNRLFANNLELILNKYRKEIVSGNIDNVFDSYRLIFIMECYCDTKNITIKEEELSNSVYFTDSVKTYFREISKYPLLTLEEERMLGKKILDGDEDAREKLILSNLKLVVSIARRYVSRGLDLLDLIQEGNMGLTSAAFKYDVNRGYKFATYATWWIRQSITRALEEKGRTIRIPSHVYEKLNRYRNVKQLLESRLNRTPSINEIASYMDISVDVLTNLLLSYEDVVSMNLLVGEEEETELGDFISSYEDGPEYLVAMDMMKERVWKLIDNSNLTDKERNVLICRFNLDGKGIRTLDEIGKMYGITRERVRQIESRVLRKLRMNKNVKDFSDYMDKPDRALESVKREKIVSKRVYTRRVSIYEYFNSYSKEDIDRVMKTFNTEELKLLDLKFGKGGFLSKKNDIIINEKLIPKMRKLLECKKDGKKMKKVKTIYEYFSEYSFEEINLVVDGLNDKDKALLVERYGNDLENPVSTRMSKEDTNNFYGNLIPKIKRLLKKRFGKNEEVVKVEEENKNSKLEEVVEVVTSEETVEENVQVEEVSLEYERLFSVLRLPRFNEIMNYFSPKEMIVILLKLGYVDNKYYSNDMISKFLDISNEEIINVTKKALELYKVNLTSLLDDVLLDNDNTKKLKK